MSLAKKPQRHSKTYMLQPRKLDNLKFMVYSLEKRKTDYYYFFFFTQEGKLKHFGQTDMQMPTLQSTALRVGVQILKWILYVSVSQCRDLV